jgi:uncharacterized protein (DUF58 family)
MRAPTEAAKDAYLLSPDFLRKLEQVTVVSRRILAGRTKGERRSARRGTSVEFADYRSYNPGDDLRYLDWNAYARLDRLFLKLFMEEEDLHVYVLLDASASMGHGTPGKLQWGVEMAAALGYSALCSGDRLQVLVYHDGKGDRTRLLRGRGASPELFEWLAARQPAGPTDLPRLVEWFLRTAPAPGLVFVISDLLTPDWEKALSRLAAARGGGCVLQVLAPEELEPGLQGDLRLLDCETEAACEVTMGATVLRRYREGRDRFLTDVHAAAGRYGFAHLLCPTSERVEDVVLRSLRRLGVTK